MKNGRDLGVAFDLPPRTKGPFFPAVAFKNAQVCQQGSPHEPSSLCIG